MRQPEKQRAKRWVKRVSHKERLRRLSLKSKILIGCKNYKVRTSGNKLMEGEKPYHALGEKNYIDSQHLHCVENL
ncbi:hypothetical protein PSY31_22885, partial [Shigella flexneri]|nr:hypothetical protein [Shigella flexneri]